MHDRTTAPDGFRHHERRGGDMFSETTKARQVGSVWVERLFPTGAYRLTWLGEGPTFSATYVGYSQRDALAIFRRERREGTR